MDFSKLFIPSTVNAAELEELLRTAIWGDRNWDAGWFLADLLVHHLEYIFSQKTYYFNAHQIPFFVPEHKPSV